PNSPSSPPGTNVLVLNGFLASVTGDFVVGTGFGGVRMVDGDTLVVSGNASFSGGNTTNRLDGGVLLVGGDFTQFNTPDGYAPTGTHKLVLNGTATQTITLADPGNSVFRDLEIVNSLGGVTLASVVAVGGSFSHTSAAILQGTGTLDLSAATIVAFDGDVNPGTSPGILGIIAPAGGLPQSAASSFNIELEGTTVGTGYDRLNFSGTVTLNGDLFVDTNGFAPTAGDQFAILTYGSRTGQFANVVLPTITGVLLDTLWAEAGTTDTLYILAASAAPANLNAWTNASGGTWSTASNWSENAVPVSTDSVVIEIDGTYTVTLDVDPAFSSITLGGATGTQTLAGSSRTIGGTGTVTVRPNGRLSLTSSTVNADVVNEGTVVMIPIGTGQFTGAVTNAAGAILRAQGPDGFARTVTVATGFTNEGTIELTSAGGGTLTFAVTSGTLVNAPSGTIVSLAGAGGDRTLAAQLDNQGTVTVTQPLTLTQSSADHLNSGLLELTTGNLTITQSGTSPSFTTTGTVTIGAGRTLTVSGGTFDYQSGALGGTGTLALSSATLALGVSLTRDTLALSVTSSTINGPGTLTVPAGRTLSLTSSTVNADLVNEGTVVMIPIGTGQFTGAVTNAAGAILRAQGPDGFARTVTVATGFTNEGTIELTSAGGGTLTFAVTSGTLVNAPSGTIVSLAGAGGARTLAAQLDNQGTVTVTQPLTLTQSSADHLNSGLLELTTGDFTLSQSGTTPTFTNEGLIDIGSSRTFAASGGTFTNASAATLRGAGTLDISNTTFANSGNTNPGTSPGILSITGTFPQDDVAALNIEIGGTAPGNTSTDHDQLGVSGDVTLAGTLNVTLLGGFTPSPGDRFVILTFTGTRTGTFATENVPAGCSVDYTPTNSVDLVCS
ncbi:MAG TPA: hypothetical protein VF970_13245, partial [Gemmatimonadales bacterium]